LGRALPGTTDRLDAAALADSMAAHADALGAMWGELLTNAERHLLAAAHRSKQHPGMARYAGLELGLALETALRERCIDPLRQSAAEALAGLAADEPKALIGYLQGGRRPPTLGDMVGLYGQVLTHWDAPPSGLAAHLRWSQAGPDRRPCAETASSKAAARRGSSDCSRSATPAPISRSRPPPTPSSRPGSTRRATRATASSRCWGGRMAWGRSAHDAGRVRPPGVGPRRCQRPLAGSPTWVMRSW
jgi:hypothetical protein